MEFRFGSDTVVVNTPDLPSLLARLRDRLGAGEGFALATINLDHLVKLARDARFRAAYGAQDLVVADGNPIVWLSRLARRPVALVPGSDLVWPVLELAAGGGYPVALVGATPEALALAEDRIRARLPDVRIVTCIAPPMGFDPEGALAEEVLAKLQAQDARLCLLALGAPKQERFAAFGRSRAPRVGFVSIGAGLDFIAGTQVRAPLWVRRLALEWLWRMLSDPRRLVPRYAACAAILPGQLRAALALRQRG